MDKICKIAVCTEPVAGEIGIHIPESEGIPAIDGMVGVCRTHLRMLTAPLVISTCICSPHAADPRCKVHGMVEKPQDLHAV